MACTIKLVSLNALPFAVTKNSILPSLQVFIRVSCSFSAVCRSYEKTIKSMWPSLWSPAVNCHLHSRQRSVQKTKRNDWQTPRLSCNGLQPIHCESCETAYLKACKPGQLQGFLLCPHQHCGPGQCCLPAQATFPYNL